MSNVIEKGQPPARGKVATLLAAARLRGLQRTEPTGADAGHRQRSILANLFPGAALTGQITPQHRGPRPAGHYQAATESPQRIVPPVPLGVEAADPVAQSAAPGGVVSGSRAGQPAPLVGAKWRTVVT